ncbi:hypothetical protein CJ739_2856 [Mariniflexile rhizosphaerae]|uniref:hypothetical protein n=1 Tax=unclassified Mariniflexile TaxID=2643887 RepID=UPI000E3378BB|nr:hypothetical protein CJ739_2856 [Mariniflexile sp. TRM1-10]
MIPTDSEFSMLYFIYGITFTLILYGLFFTSKKKEFWYHLIFYSLYAGLMSYVFSDKENFSGGGSLVVLFYGFIFPVFHLIVYGIIKLIKLIRNNRTEKTV